MSERPNRVLPTLLFAFLMTATVLAIQPAHAYPVTDKQQLAAEATHGDGAPYSPWQVRTDTNRIYLESSDTNEEPGAFAQGTPTGAKLTAVPPTNLIGLGTCWQADWGNGIGFGFSGSGEPCTQADATADADPNDKAALIALPGTIVNAPAPVGPIRNDAALSATFPLDPVLDDVMVYEVNFYVYAACFAGALEPTAGAARVFGFNALLREQEKDATGAWVNVAGDPLTQTGTSATMRLIPFSLGGNPPGYIQGFSGSNGLGDSTSKTGRTIEKGHRLAATFSMPNPGTSTPDACVLHFGSLQFQSQISFLDNGARIGTFAEDAQGERTIGFPAGDSTTSANRRINVVVLQASPWPGMEDQLLMRDGVHSVHLEDPDLGFDADISYLNALPRVNVRLFDLEKNQYLYYVENLDGGQNAALEKDIHVIERLSRTEKAIGPSLVERRFEFAYGGDLTKVIIQPEVYAWSTSDLFARDSATDPTRSNAPWDTIADAIRIGGKGITFGLLAGETATHLVNPREPTQFALQLKNIGTQDDTITLTPSEVPGGWTAIVQGGGQFALAAGKTAIAIVEVTPPPSAVAPASISIPIHASSSYDDVTDPAPVTLRTTLTDAVTHHVTLSTASTLVHVRPGVAKSFALTLHNDGTQRESFIVIPSFPANIQGWTISLAPTSVQVPGGGSVQVQAVITPPAEAPGGQSFTLGLTAVSVGDSAVSSRVDVSVGTFPVEGVTANLLDPLTNRTLRGKGDSTCVGGGADPTTVIDVLTCTAAVQAGQDPTGLAGAPTEDTDYDSTGLFRIGVNNLGDNEDKFRAEAFWVEDHPGKTDNPTCQESYTKANVQDNVNTSPPDPDGVPDGWRFNGPNDLGKPFGNTPQTGAGGRSGFSGVTTLSDATTPLVVPARSTSNLLIEVGKLTGNPCPAYADPLGQDVLPFSEAAWLGVRITSLVEPTRTTLVVLHAGSSDPGTFLGTNRYSGAIHGVGLQLDGTTPSTKAGTLGSPIVYDLVAYNSGNEFDDMNLAVNDAPGGWTHKLIQTSSLPPGILCDLPTNDGRAVHCPNLGVFDEVHFQVIATPGNTARVGDRDTLTVSAISGDAPGISRTLSLVARAAGTYQMVTGALGATTRAVTAGQTVSFPLSIDNQGTADDSYRLSLLRGGAEWRPVLSSSAPLFIPADHDLSAFLTVTAPASAATGLSDVFKVQIESLGSGTKQTIEFSPVVQAASNLLLAGRDGQDVLIAKRGVDTNVTVKAIQLAGTAPSSMSFDVDASSLPHGWTIDRTHATATPTTDSNGRPTAVATFKVKAPADALGTSRGLLHVEGLAGTIHGATDINLNLASTYGIALTATNGTKQIIAPGGSAVFNLTLQNLGLGTDTVRLTNTVLPSGWRMFFSPTTVALGPLEKHDVTAKLTAPTTAQPADIASVVLFASSLTDTTQVTSLPLSAQVGFNALTLKAVSDIVPRGAPQETIVQVFNLTNNGTLPDEVRIGSVLDTLGLVRLVNVTITPTLVSLKPNETVQLRLDQTLADTIPSNITLQTTTTVKSLLDARTVPASAALASTAKVLPFVFSDVNGDGRRDFAIDRNENAADGYEQFAASATAGGRPLAAADLERFLRDDVREAKSVDITLANGTVVRAVVVTIDGDGDGKVDHFLDSDGDGQPDFYWDPDANKVSPIEFRKDINGDQVPESFVDTNGDGKLDAVYDMTRAEFTKVIQLDVDGDGQLDYVVDKNGNGIVDQDETVLYTRAGSLLIVQKVDVDGDGKLDQVFDTNGDGNPDYFIPAGSTGAVPIVLRDVNGDGTADWTFDGDNDGRRESYYDPVTGQAHVIDAAGHFMDALAKYWYIGALFVVVLALFVALVMVTRR